MTDTPTAPGLLADIDDLIKQATTEHSHYYTASVLRRAREAIVSATALLSASEALKAGYIETCSRQADALAKARVALEEVQWGRDSEGECPSCGNVESEGHHPACRIGAALEAMK